MHHSPSSLITFVQELEDGEEVYRDREAEMPRPAATLLNLNWKEVSDYLSSEIRVRSCFSTML